MLNNANHDNNIRLNIHCVTNHCHGRRHLVDYTVPIFVHILSQGGATSA